jgi:hypothetical protein
MEYKGVIQNPSPTSFLWAQALIDPFEAIVMLMSIFLAAGYLSYGCGCSGNLGIFRAYRDCF